MSKKTQALLSLVLLLTTILSACAPSVLHTIPTPIQPPEPYVQEVEITGYGGDVIQNVLNQVGNGETEINCWGYWTDIYDHENIEYNSQTAISITDQNGETASDMKSLKISSGLSHNKYLCTFPGVRVTIHVQK